MIKFFGGVILTIVVLIGGVFYFLIGTGPKDLGVKFTVSDSAAARNKLGTQIIPIVSGIDKKDFTLEGKKNTDLVMDSLELTALSNNRPWKNYPIKNLQIKIWQDGTIEASATLVISKALPYAMALGYSETQIKDAMKKYNIPQFEVPFYVRGRGQVVNDEVTVAAKEIQIGKVNIPSTIVDQINIEAKNVLEDLIKKQSQSFHAESVTFSEGKMHFKGTVAEKEYVVTE